MPRKKINTSELIWTQLRGLYGSGLFASVKEMYPHAKKLYADKCPAELTIQNKVQKEGWKKTLYRERLEIAQEQSFREMFDDAGLGDKAMVDTIVEAVNHHKNLVKKVMQKIEESNGELSMDVVEGLENAVQNLNVTHKFLTLRCKLTGSESPDKVNVRQKGLSFEQDLSPEEKLKELERVISNHRN